MIEKMRYKKATLLLFSILLLLVFGSVVVETKTIDILYLLALVAFIIRYISMKK